MNERHYEVRIIHELQAEIKRLAAAIESQFQREQDLRAQLAEAQEHFDEFAQERFDECAALDDRILAIEQIAQGLASALDSHGPYLPTDPAHAALRALAAYQQRKGK